jgi:hypothetical protein
VGKELIRPTGFATFVPDLPIALGELHNGLLYSAVNYWGAAAGYMLRTQALSKQNI